VLHANDHRAFWNTAFGARLAGAKVIFNVRDTMREGASPGQWRRALRVCDRFLVLSREMVAAWQRDLAPVSEQVGQAQKFAYIYSIVDRSHFSPVSADERARLRAELGVEEGRPAIAYVGRFDDKKAQLALIREALPAIAAQRPDAVTYFIGDFEPKRDSYAAACFEAVSDSRLDAQVRFMGYSARTADWYRAADIVLLASQREGLPRCMIESLACGSAFATFDVCSTREILEGHDCGIVVPRGNYAALAHATVNLLADDLRRDEFARRGPEVVAALFDARINGETYRALLAELANSSA
jgi:glycosyltransferase involved in cell wall biosynthesis